MSDITNNLIAMGFPCEDVVERLYRNDMREVMRFLDARHGECGYRVYNLCKEKGREYDTSCFHDRVARYGFFDHHPPPFELILKICQDIHGWLAPAAISVNTCLGAMDTSGLDINARKQAVEILETSHHELQLQEKSQQRVAVIHCKAGKGRTGLVICCYLLFSGISSSAEEAMDLYGVKRTVDGDGLTLQSQRRYVHYFEHFLRLSHCRCYTDCVLSYSPTERRIIQVELSGWTSRNTPIVTLITRDGIIWMSSTVLPKQNEGKSRLTRASSSVSTPVVATMTEDGKDTIPRLQQCLTWTLPNSGGVVKAKGDVLVLLHSKRFLRRRGGHFAESLWSGVRAKKRGDNLETEGVEISGVVRTALARAWVNLEFF